MKNDNKLRRWEIALALSLCITFCHGLAFPGAGINWWGVIFPGLAGDGTAEQAQVKTSSFPDGKDEEVQVRLRFLEWIEDMNRDA